MVRVRVLDDVAGLCVPVTVWVWLCVVVWAPGLLGLADFLSAPDPENQIGSKRSPCLHTHCLTSLPSLATSCPAPHFFHLPPARQPLPTHPLAGSSIPVLPPLLLPPEAFWVTPVCTCEDAGFSADPSPCLAPGASFLSILLPSARLTQVLEGSVPCSALVPWAQHKAAGSEEGSTY